MKTIIKAILSAAVIFLVALSFTSCGEKYSWTTYPVVNKNIFEVTGSVKEDTLYDIYDENIKIDAVHVGKGEEWLDEVPVNENSSEIKDGDAVVGNIEYKNNEIYKISFKGWCTITKDESGKHAKAFLIKGEGAQKRPYSLYLWVSVDSGPAQIEIK